MKRDDLPRALESIPRELREKRGWLLYKLVPKKDKPGKFDKVPYYANGGKRHGTQGSDEDRASLGTFDEAVTTLQKGGKKYDGLGFAMLPEWGLVCIDLDHCVALGGGWTPLTMQVLAAATVDTYIEHSPSGEGLHVWLRGTFRDAKNAAGGVEVFCAKGFLTMTGQLLEHVDGAELQPLSPEMGTLLEEKLGKGGRGEKEKKKRGRPRKALKLTLEQAEGALEYVDPDDRDRWLSIGIILGRAFNRRSEAWTLYERWAMKSRKFEVDRGGNLSRMREAFYKRSIEAPQGEELTVASLIQWAREGGCPEELGSTAGYEKFWAIRPAAKFLYVPSGALWTAQAVNDALPPRLVGMSSEGEPVLQPAAQWLAQNRGIESVVFDPALPQIVKDRVAREQGLIDDEGATLFNRYYPPTVKGGNPKAAAPFEDHVRRLFPATGESDHILRWLAHRVQRPGEKVRHALLIGGPPGVGKDTIIEAILPALGQWNVASISPDEIFQPFNEYAASVLVRINEVVDLHEISRFKFYEATKVLIAGNPEYVAVNPKYGTKFHVRNCAGVVMTTNYGSTGMYLTADDRRHFAVETIGLWGKPEEREDYFSGLWTWLVDGDGFAHVAAFLNGYSLQGFNPHAPPPKTETFKKIVASCASGDNWLIDALERLGDPSMVRGDALRRAIGAGLSPNEITNRLGPAMARRGYDLYPNPQRADGRHNLKGLRSPTPEQAPGDVRVQVYVRRGTPANELEALFNALDKQGQSL